MFSTREFGRMKPDAALANTAPDPIVDVDALVGATEADGLYGAGLNVFPDKPAAESSATVSHHAGIYVEAEA